VTTTPTVEREPEREDHGIVRIFAQFSEHSPCDIVANRAGLKSLAKAIETALREGTGRAEPEAGDGEGYALTVQMRNGAGMSRGGSHYVARHLDQHSATEREQHYRIVEYLNGKVRALQPKKPAP